MVGGFVVGIVALRIGILAKFLGMKLMFTAIKKAGKRALSNWYVREVKNWLEYKNVNKFHF